MDDEDQRLEAICRENGRHILTRLRKMHRRVKREEEREREIAEQLAREIEDLTR